MIKKLVKEESLFLVMPLFKDQLGEEVRLEKTPERIISLVPSQSEFLWDLGAGKKLVGITKFCIHPDEMFRSVERVGGTKKLDLQKIWDLKPDLIIGNKEENERSQIDELKKEFPVWMSDIITLTDAYEMMRETGKIVGKEEQSELMISQITSSFTEVLNFFKGKSAAYLVWKDPLMVCGGNTFIDHVLRHLGIINVFGGQQRYPEVSVRELKDAKPDLIFLSSEPYPFREKHCRELQAELTKAKVLVVDGEMFSWYGSRLLKSAAYFKRLRDEIIG